MMMRTPETRLRLLGLLFLLCGIIAMLFWIHEVKAAWSLRHDTWERVTGFAKSYRLDYTGGLKCSGWSLDCEYSYQFQGVPYESDCVSIASRSNDEVLDAYRRIESGKGKVPVWVNVRSPDVSVLVVPEKHGYRSSIVLGLIVWALVFGGVLLAVGIVERLERSSGIRKGPDLVVNSSGEVKVVEPRTGEDAMEHTEGVRGLV